jgi:Uma2 family endonuclease
MVQAIPRPSGPPIVPGQTIKMSYEEFLALPDDVRAEWVDGEAIIFVTNKPPHAEAVSFLVTLLRLFVRRFALGTVRAGSMEMRILGGCSSRDPDVTFISNDRLHLLTADRLDGPADLAIEVISPDSVTRDRRDKRREYERAGVREYWIADVRPRQRRFDAWAVDDNGVYQPLAPDEHGRVHSTVLPGFWLRPEWLWQEQTPNELTVLEEILVTEPTTQG